MKVVHNVAGEVTRIDNALKWEQTGKWDKAIEVYKSLIKENPVNVLAYHRLMIVYRKQKNYVKELSVIRAGIRAFENLYQPSAGLVANKKVVALSRALLKTTGLGDKKGKPLYQKEPIGSWTRRKVIVKKKLEKPG